MKLEDDEWLTTLIDAINKMMDIANDPHRQFQPEERLRMRLIAEQKLDQYFDCIDLVLGVVGSP